MLVHSVGLSHREFEPAVEDLAHRFRLILPDLPAHGDSEDRPRHPYTFDWLAEVLAAFCTDVGGPAAAGRRARARRATCCVRAIELGRLDPGRLVLMPCRLHRPPERRTRARRVAGRGAGGGAAGPRPRRGPRRAAARSGPSAGRR